MTKYIIKNCLSYENGVCDNQDRFCKDCTDCVLKQIVKKCRKSLEVSYCPIEQEILELLDIQEVE